MFKQFIRHFNIRHRHRRADMITKIDLFELIKKSVSVSKTSRLESLSPYCFQTDGGTYNDDYYYFIQNIFSRSNICYSTKTPKNANV